MVKPIKIQEMGNSLSIINDDGTRIMCYPSAGGLWFCGGVGTIDPTPPVPGNDEIAWPFSESVITSGYGPRAGGVGSFHEGIDFSGGKAVRGASCRVAADGVVKISTTNSGFGNYVGVFHKTMDGFDFWTVYGHLDSRSVSVGKKVYQGDEVGKLGATGYITGPCLHWETHKCPIGGSPRWQTANIPNSGRTAVDPVAFMTQYGGDDILNA